MLCCRVCKSTPIIFISASFVPSNLWLEHHQFTRLAARPTSLCHQTGRLPCGRIGLAAPSLQNVRRRLRRKRDRSTTLRMNRMTAKKGRAEARPYMDGRRGPAGSRRNEIKTGEKNRSLTAVRKQRDGVRDDRLRKLRVKRRFEIPE